MSTQDSHSIGMDKKLEDHLKSLLKDKGEELEKTLGCLIDGDVSLDNLNKIWKKRVKQKDCGKEEYPAVERIIDKFIEWEKNFGEAYHKLGNIYYRRKFYEEAKSNYKKALKIEEWEKEEDKAWCYHDLGYLLYGAREYKDAVDNYNEAIKIAKKLKKEKSIAWFYIDLGTARMKSGRYEAADKAFVDALSLIKKDKDKAYVYNALGRLYYRKRLYEEARKKLEQAKEHNPDLDKVYNNLGLLDLEAGSYENAKLCFQKAIEMDKSEKKFFFCLAEKDARIFLFNLEQEIKVPEDGIVPINSELYKKFVHIGEPLSDNAKLSTIDKKSWVIVDGEDRYWIEKNDNALKVYKVLLKDGPIEPELKNQLEEKGLPLPADSTVNKENGKWVITDKEKKEIYCIVRKEDGKLNIYAKKKCENLAAAHLNLGDVFFKEGKIKDAGKEYEEAIRIDRNSAEAYYSLGNLAAKNEEKERAEKLYGEALRINPDYTKARTALEALDLPKEAGVDWWSWWFRRYGEWPKRRKFTGGLLIIALLCIIGIIGFITLMPLVGTLMPPGNVTYEHKNDTTFSYQKISIENSFSVDAKFENDLNNQSISKELENTFKTKGFSISESKNATVTKEKDNKWVIADGEKIYIVEKVEGKLIVYTGSVEEIKKEITETFSNATTPRTETIPSFSIWTLIGLAVFIFFILIFPQLKTGSVSIGEFKFEIETKDAGTSDIAK